MFDTLDTVIEKSKQGNIPVTDALFNGGQAVNYILNGYKIGHLILGKTFKSSKSHIKFDAYRGVFVVVNDTGNEEVYDFTLPKLLSSEYYIINNDIKLPKDKVHE
jgi:hypothetical protein